MSCPEHTQPRRDITLRCMKSYLGWFQTTPFSLSCHILFSKVSTPTFIQHNYDVFFYRCCPNQNVTVCNSDVLLGVMLCLFAMSHYLVTVTLSGVLTFHITRTKNNVGIAQATRCDVAHLRVCVRRVLRWLKIACDVLQ